MKLVVFLIALVSAVANADVARITCDLAKNASRAESIKKVRYVVDLKDGSAQLECSEAISNEFCGSIRMDLSKALTSLQNDCRSRQKLEAVTLRFYLVQEDEFDNLVEMRVPKSCNSGTILLPGEFEAKILTYAYGSFNERLGGFESSPIATDTVRCSGLVSGGRR